jgi:hypothetical protein
MGFARGGSNPPLFKSLFALSAYFPEPFRFVFSGVSN